MSTTDTQSLDFDDLEQGKITKISYSEADSIKVLEKLALQKLKEYNPDNHYSPELRYSDKTSNEAAKCIIDYILFNDSQAERVNYRSFIKNNRKTPTYTLGAIAICSNEWIYRIRKREAVYIHSVINRKFVRIEVKIEATGDNNHPKGQTTYQSKIKVAESYYLTVSNFTDFYNWLNDFYLEQSKNS
ncbi:hypothetical protein [uncultured Flavobacterium sp.]|uniref:hypothetical protein n=1 Tax=uncultured Flavobacterium sp. TaxID=165435 RepID=UPI0030ED2E54|tara:strand:+ start:2757 stop:3317 length:561 start_codon:yes stop_codon:yes gene_type:complete